MGEVGQSLNDPSYAINLVAGPPFPELKPQQPGSGLVITRQFVGAEPQRFVFKKAHMSREDFRVFDSRTGRVVAAMHHSGKNPYGKLDPLGTSNFVKAHESWIGEWESLAQISGYNGMPSLKIRPKNLSRHGRQNVFDFNKVQIFNIGKESKLKNLALRSNLAVRRGDTKDIVYRVLPDLMGRTFQVVNEAGELVCFVQKSAKTLITEVALGVGSEMLIDVAPGVDWTAMVAVVLAIQQVGAHFAKDALSNALDPVKDSVVQGALQSTGASGVAGGVGANVDQAMHFIRQAQALHRMFVQ